jgi:long-chain fatty acid transport protein
VAGADDLGALYFNPAGLVDAGTQVLVDASWLHFTSSFQRRSLVQPTDPNTGKPVGSPFVQTYEKVEGSTPVLPIPTLAASLALSPDLVIATGIYAPYGAVASYPEKLPGGQPSPQRYSLLSLDGSALAVVGAWVAYRPLPWLQVGAGPTLLFGNFQSSVQFGACVPDRFLCAPEQPDFDAKARLTVGPIHALSGTLGVTVLPADYLRIGGSFQLPYSVDAPAKFETKLPAASVFDHATVSGDAARVQFKLPWIARVGVEARPQPTTRVELAFVFEKWSMHDKIDVQPDGVTLQNVALFPPEYRVGSLSLPRNFQDAWSLRLGGEQSIAIGGYQLDVRAGVMYEKSAVPPAYLSVLTVDMDKFVIGTGLGLHIGKAWRFDGTLAVLLPSKVDVAPEEAAIHKVNPVRSNQPPTSDPAINGGSYEARALVLGMGLRYQFGAAEEPVAAAAGPGAGGAAGAGE